MVDAMVAEMPEETYLQIEMEKAEEEISLMNATVEPETEEIYSLIVEEMMTRRR